MVESLRALGNMRFSTNVSTAHTAGKIIFSIVYLDGILLPSYIRVKAGKNRVVLFLLNDRDEMIRKSNPRLPSVTILSLGRVRRRCASLPAQVTLVKDNIMPRLIILSGVNDEGVRVDVSRAYASISSNAQCQVSPNNRTFTSEVRTCF